SAVNNPPGGLLISQDLLFTSKVTGTARHLGIGMEVVPDCASATSRLAGCDVRCVFIDLSQVGSNLPQFFAAMPPGKRPTVIAFGSYVATAQLQMARDLGCDDVMPRSRFSAELPALLRRYAEERRENIVE